jgi:ribosomal protein L22
MNMISFVDDLDNALVDQKNQILNLVRDGQYEEALALLDFSKGLWETCRYAYKTREIRNIIRDELTEKRNVCGHWKQHQKWAKLLEKVV